MTRPDRPHPHELLSAYRDGELDAPERTAVERHVERCAACRRLLADLDRIGRSIAAEPVPAPPADLPARIAARLADAARPPDAPRRLRLPPQWLAAAASLAVVAVATVIELSERPLPLARKGAPPAASAPAAPKAAARDEAAAGVAAAAQGDAAAREAMPAAESPARAKKKEGAAERQLAVPEEGPAADRTPAQKRSAEPAAGPPAAAKPAPAAPPEEIEIVLGEPEPFRPSPTPVEPEAAGAERRRAAPPAPERAVTPPETAMSDAAAERAPAARAPAAFEKAAAPRCRATVAAAGPHPVWRTADPEGARAALAAELRALGGALVRRDAGGRRYELLLPRDAVGAFAAWLTRRAPEAELAPPGPDVAGDCVRLTLEIAPQTSR